MSRYEAIIKVDPTDQPLQRVMDIKKGIRYACALLVDEYGRTSEEVAGWLEDAADDVRFP